MKNQKFGIEIEMTGITRNKAARVIAEYFQTEQSHIGSSYDKYTVADNIGRKWNIVYDSSIQTEAVLGGTATSNYAVELVSPICEYSDIEMIQGIVRALRINGAMVNESCGIHVHVDGRSHTPRTLRNLVNIVYGKDHVIYKALNISANRLRYCREVENGFLTKINERKPHTMKEIADIWYRGQSDSRRLMHYNDTRYRGLNLHNLLAPNGKGSVEFRLFNSTLHAGEVKAYIQFCLGVNNQALIQKKANAKQTYCGENERYFMNSWLKRLGFIGEEFATARHHMLKNLTGNLSRYSSTPAQTGGNI